MGDVWGIRLERKIDDWGVIWGRRLERKTGDSGATYTLVFAKREKSGEPHLFFTSKAIHDAIARAGPHKLEGKKLGAAAFLVERIAKRITSMHFYPLTTGVLGPKKGLRLFGKIGIATLAELRMERDLLQRYPGYRITSTSDPDAPRIRQLAKRGREAGETIAIEDAVKLTKKKVREDRRKATDSLRGSLRAIIRRRA